MINMNKQKCHEEMFKAFTRQNDLSIERYQPNQLVNKTGAD